MVPGSSPPCESYSLAAVFLLFWFPTTIAATTFALLLLFASKSASASREWRHLRRCYTLLYVLFSSTNLGPLLLGMYALFVHPERQSLSDTAVVSFHCVVAGIYLILGVGTWR